MISPFGYLLVPAAGVLFFRGRRPLLWATLLAVPFTRLEVVNIGVTTLVAYQVFGTLLIARCLIDAGRSGRRGLKRSWANALAALFLFVCFASLSMAVLKGGDVVVFGEQTTGTWVDVESYKKTLQLSRLNLTQILFPTFGSLLFHFLVREFRSATDLKRAINILVGAALVTAGMSIASGVLYTTGLGSVYRTLLGLGTVGPIGGTVPEAASVGQFMRTYTWAGEPGFTSMTLLTGVGLILGDLLRKETSVTRRPRAKLALLGLALLFNGSTTGYFGAALLVLWGVIAPWYVGVGSLGRALRSVGLILGGLVVAGGVASMIQVEGLSFYEWLTEYHLAKMQGEAGSGVIRSYVAWYTFNEVFLASPILGVGYGSHLSLSFVTFLLANVGLIGFSVFLGFLYVTFRNAKKTFEHAREPLQSVAFIAAFLHPPFLGMLFVATGTAAMNYGLTWTVIALAEATYQVHRRRHRTAHQAVGTE